MKRYLLAACAAIIVVVLGWSFGGTAPTDVSAQGGGDQGAYTFEEIGDGVYFGTGTGKMTTMSNALIIVNDDHAMLVDTSVSPAAARALVREIGEEVTDKPIRYVFNSHYHFDHAHGNQIFGPEVEIIGHDFVRQMHLSNVLEQRTNRSFTAGLPAQIESLKEQVAAATDATDRMRLETTLQVTEAHYTAIQETRPTPPTVTYNDTMTIHKGGREVQLHFVGRGHTGGDTMVFLPAERIVFTGDFFVGAPGANGLPYMGDGYVNEWPASLDGLKGLDFDTMVPGHGQPFDERSQIDDLQRYLRDLWTQVADLRAEGVSAEDATGRVDLSAHRASYGARVDRVDPRAVLRIYEILQVQMPM